MDRRNYNPTLRLSEHLTSSSVATLGHSSELDGSRLSPHFTLGEMTKTRVKIENVPNEAQVETPPCRGRGVETKRSQLLLILDTDLRR